MTRSSMTLPQKIRVVAEGMLEFIGTTCRMVARGKLPQILFLLFLSLYR